MTMRGLGEVGIKLIGFYLALSVLRAFFQIITTFASSPIEGFDTRTAATLQTLYVFSVIATAFICLRYGKMLAERLFEEDEKEPPRISRRDLLSVGVAVLGVGLAANALPAVIQFAGRLLWFAESSRQSLLPDLFRNSWEPLSSSLLQLGIGMALAIKAGTIAAKLDHSNQHRWRAHEPEEPLNS